jgi:hypothetical protein
MVGFQSSWINQLSWIKLNKLDQAGQAIKHQANGETIYLDWIIQKIILKLEILLMRKILGDYKLITHLLNSVFLLISYPQGIRLQFTISELNKLVNKHYLEFSTWDTT